MALLNNGIKFLLINIKTINYVSSFVCSNKAPIFSQPKIHCCCENNLKNLINPVLSFAPDPPSCCFHKACFYVALKQWADLHADSNTSHLNLCSKYTTAVKHTKLKIRNVKIIQHYKISVIN